jgi:hypothetical protein
MRISMLTLGVAFLVATSASNAETCGEDGGNPCCDTISTNDSRNCVVPANVKYLFTIKRFGFENAAGAITWTGTQTSFDAASTGVGAAMGAFISNVSLPAGTYVAVRPEISKDFTVSGSGKQTTDGVACSSGGDQAGDLVSLMLFLGDPIANCNDNPALDGDLCNAGGGTIRIRDTSLGSFTVDASFSRTINFKFDVGSAMTMTANGGACTFSSMGLLDVSLSFTIDT